MFTGTGALASICEFQSFEYTSHCETPAQLNTAARDMQENGGSTAAHQTNTQSCIPGVCRSVCKRLCLQRWCRPVLPSRPSTARSCHGPHSACPCARVLSESEKRPTIARESARRKELDCRTHGSIAGPCTKYELNGASEQIPAADWKSATPSHIPAFSAAVVRPVEAASAAACSPKPKVAHLCKPG